MFNSNETKKQGNIPYVTDQIQKPSVFQDKINLIHLDQFRVFPSQLPETFNLYLKFQPLIEGIPVKMVYPGISSNRLMFILVPDSVPTFALPWTMR
jgi:hypothetical protein